MMMNKFIDITNEKKPETIDLIGAVSLSTGDGLETTQRYKYDYSKSPVSVVYRRRNTALTATIQTVFNNALCMNNNISMMEYIARLESLAGHRVKLIWNDNEITTFIIQSVQIAGSVDCEDLFSQVQVSFSLTEGFVRHETVYTGTSVL